jgi:hypothetical protein
MRVTRGDLDAAVRAGVIDRPAADALWRFLGRRGDAGGGSVADAEATPFDLRHLLWYAGGLIVIAGLGLFAVEVSERFGGLALAALAAGYGALFAGLGDALWRRHALRVPGGLLVTAAVAMAPLAVFGIQDHYNWWSLLRADPADDFGRWVLGGGVPMALAAALAGVVALRFCRFAFLAMVIALAMWFVAMDLATWRAEAWPGSLAQVRGLVSIAFGALVLAAAWLVDMRQTGRREAGERQRTADFGFWLHLAAGLAMLGGAFAALTATRAGWAVLCALSIAMVLVSVFVRRRVHALFGAIGVGAYLVYLSSVVFTDVLVFSFALAAIGIAIMLLGLVYHRTLPRLQDWLARHLPAGLQRLRPAPPSR